MMTKPTCRREVMAMRTADGKLEIECPFPLSRKNKENANRTVDKHKLERPFNCKIINCTAKLCEIAIKHFKNIKQDFPGEMSTKEWQYDSPLRNRHLHLI